MPLPLRHADQHKIICIRKINEPLVDPREIDPDVVEHEPDLSPLNQAQEIGALPVDIPDAVQKAGDNDLAPGVFILRKHLMDQHPRIHRFEHGDGRDRLSESPFAAQHLRLPQRRQLEKIRYRYAHTVTLFSFSS